MVPLDRRGSVWGNWIGLVAALISFQHVRAQEAPAPGPAPAAITAAPSLPPEVPASPPSVKQLSERLEAMEALNRRLAEQLEKTNQAHDAQMKQLLDKVGELSKRLSDANEGPSADRNTSAGGMPTADGGRVRDIDGPVPEYETQPNGPVRSVPGFPAGSITGPRKIPFRGNFGPGFQFQTDDEEFLLQFHYQSQVEARVWGQSNQVPVTSGFFFPRQRIFFNGRITKPVEYVFSINQGFGGLSLLDVFFNYHPSDRFQVRFGRYMTPLTYEQYAIRNIYLMTPERSLFTTNVGLNRQIGLMAWGYLFDKRLDYAAGVFNGPRNSFEDLNWNKDFVGFLNARPFQESETLTFAKLLNVGTSIAYGRQNQPPVPQSYRIGAVAPTNVEGDSAASLPFLTLNRDVAERGDRLLGSVHGAYFYKGLSLIGEWQYGYNSFASASRRSPAAVPVSGFYVAGSYFLTGEDVERRAMVEPRRPFVPTSKGQIRGLGAWELAGRVSDLRLGNQIFSAGFADPNLWSHQAVTTEVGLNWYWNEYVKFYLFWLHGEFADPIVYRPGERQKTADMFWLRFQLFF